MVTRRQFLTTCATALTTAVTGRSAAQPVQARLAIVVNPNSSIQSISLRELRRLYRGEALNGPGGERIIPFTHPTSSRERVGFDQCVLGMSADEVARYWIDRKIRGQSGPPRAIASSETMQQLVRALVDALGYVRVELVQPDLKVVPVDGRHPRDAEYPILI